MSGDLKVSIQFLAELDELRGAVPQIKALFQQLVGVTKEVGGQTVTAAKTAGAALVDQVATPAKKATAEVKALAQEEVKVAVAAKDVAKAAGEAATQTDKVAGAAAKAAKALKTMGDDGKAGAASAAQGLQATAGQAGDLGSVVGALVQKLGLAYAGLLLFRQGLAFVKEGIGFGSQMETAQLGIGSLIAAQGKLSDATGRELTGREALNAAMVMSQDQMQKLKVAGLETVATTEQLVGAFQQAVGVGLSVGMTLDQVREVTIKVTQAAAALGLPMNQLSEEVRSLLQGNIDPRNTRIATALQITNKEVKAWKAAGGSTLADELNKRMEAFGLAGELAAQTWQGVTSNVVEATQTLAGEMTKPLFVQLKDGLQGVLNQVFDLKNARISDAFTGLVEVGQTGFGALGSLARAALDQVVGGLKDVSAWISENQTAVNGYIAMLTTMTQVVGTGLAGAFSVLGGLLGGMVTLLGSYPALILSVVGALTGLVVANGFAATSFATLAASASAAAAAVTTFFTSLGPVGWAVVAIGALAGAALGLRAARKAEQEEAKASAQRLRQEEDAAKLLVQRYETLSAELAKGTLTLAGRIKAEKEMEDVRRELIKLGGAYAQILQDENGNRGTTIQRLKDETAERERSNNARRVEMALMANLIQADIQQQKKRISMLDQNRMPDTGIAMSAAQKAELSNGWYDREVSYLKQLQEEYLLTKTIIEGMGPSASAHELTISQIKERKAELVKLIDEAGKAQEKATLGKGDEAATKAYHARREALIGMRAEWAELDRLVPDVIGLGTRGAQREKAGKAPKEKENVDAKELLRIQREGLQYQQQITLEEQRLVKVKELDFKRSEELLEIQRKREQKTLSEEGAVQARKAVEENFANARKMVWDKFAKDREALESDLQARLEAKEEGGLKARQEATRKYFKALRADNDRAFLEGKPFLTADQIISSEESALARDRVAQVAQDLAKIKQEMATMAQTLGRGLTDQEKDQVLAPHIAKGGTNAKAAGKQMDEDGRGRTGMDGFGASITSWLVESKNAFKTWKDFGTSVLGGLEGNFGSFFTSLTQHGQTFGQKTKALWAGVSGTVVQAFTKMAAAKLMDWGVAKAKLAWELMKSGWDTKETTKTVGENAIKQGSNTATASTGFFASFAGTGPWGFALAAAAIVAMFALLGSVTGRKVGGVVGQNGPEFTMLGEEGLEVVAPEADFKDWARSLVGMGANLQANISTQQGEVRRYQQQGADYAQDAVRSLPEGGTGTGLLAGLTYVNLQGAVIAGESNESKRIIAKLFRNSVDNDNRRIN